MKFREFVAQCTVALIEGNAAGISARDAGDREQIQPQQMIWSAVEVARQLEAAQLAPWKAGHADSGEAAKFISDLVARSREQRQAEEEPPVPEEIPSTPEPSSVVPQGDSVLGLGG